MYSIPFNKPYLAGKELFYIAQSVLSGKISGDGIFSKRCSKLMEEKFKAKKILLTTSCTSALEMAAILCRVGPGDEVILPSYTFVSTANAFFLRGAKLKFVDIQPDTLNMDAEAVRSAITEKTKVIVPVHYAGVGCDMDALMLLAKENGIYVIEDAAQGVNSRYKGTYLGTIGNLGTYSFHETKNFMCGEGGALVINDDSFIERAEIIREKGTNRSKFFRGEVDKYTWVDIGSSFLPSDILSAFLFAQLELMDQINVRRREIFQVYHETLSPLAKQGHLQLPSFPASDETNCHMFYILLGSEDIRNHLMDYLKTRGILAVFHYMPLHLSPIGQAMGFKPGSLPITESISGRLLRLPLYYEITQANQMDVVKTIGSFFSQEHS